VGNIPAGEDNSAGDILAEHISLALAEDNSTRDTLVEPSSGLASFGFAALAS